MARNNSNIKLLYIQDLFAKECKEIEEYCILGEKQYNSN
ncbi:putative O-methyltransferase domain protein [Wolbachia endosymbiont of Wuchereria bancrofti]|nr:putative O-methyltransferase domain protein [Wolbachia endosymbiont of Wuchereria bancrofti]